jgi:hypothetical protein
MKKANKIEIGDQVIIADEKSLFDGKAGVVVWEMTPSQLLVTILDNGSNRTVTVPRKGVRVI